MEEILLESKKYEKKYNCKYCNYRDTRLKLVSHIEKKHKDMIPQGYTAARIAFNIANKKEHGTCVECGKETPWNEDKWKYERLCGDKKCIQAASERANKNMMKVYNKTHLLNDPEQQKKMLSSRSISGEYRFADGEKRSYCGSYEKKLLEFQEKVLNYHSYDIQTPGPVIEYEFEDKKLFWITDQYIVPANLVIDVKDGGDNPNNRDMKDYREKQIAKEYAISRLGKYNYIRLTNNNFQQLLLILIKIKEQLMDNNDTDVIIDINESLATAGTMANATDNDVYVVSRTLNNTFVDDIISNKDMSKMYAVNLNNEIEKVTSSYLDDYKCIMHKYKNESNILDEIHNLYINKESVEYSPNFFYEKITNKPCICAEQIMFDELFILETDMYTKSIIETNILLETINNFNNMHAFPLANLDEICIRNNILKEYSNLDIYKDPKGYFLININDKNRSEYFNSMSELSNANAYLFDILNKGVLK